MPKEILIADANVTAQEEFEQILEGMDAQLIFAENGEDALLKIKLYKPDLVIADVTMPNKDGSELCKIVKANPELKHIPFVLLAGIFEDIDEAEQEKVGADGVIAKPLKSEKILPLMENLLKGAPVKLEMDEATPASSPEVWAEEAMPSVEGPPKIEGLDEAVMSPREAETDADQPVGEGEEEILELTDVVEEEPVGPVSPGDHGVDESLEQIMEGDEEVYLPEEGLSDISLEGIDLDEPKTEFELEELELEEESPQAGDDSTQEAEIGRIEGLELGSLEEDYEGPEGTDRAADRDLEAELEQEIDKRIDLVLEEDGEREEEDTLLELESVGGERARSLEEAETLEPFEEEITPEETLDSIDRPDASALREEDFVEPEPAKDGEGRLNEVGLPEELPTADIEELEEKEPEEPMPSDGSEETLEELEAPSAGILQEGLDEAQELSLEELEGIEESVRELEDLPMDEELEKLLDEAVPEFEESGEIAEEERFGEGLKAEGMDEVPAEEGVPMEGLDEELPPDTSPEEGVVEKALGDIEPESQGEGPDVPTLDELGEAPLEELEEELEEAEDLLEEPFDEGAEDSGEGVSYPEELIKEGEVSEEELSAFQKRLSAEFETSSSQTDLSAETPDVQVEELVRKAVEHILQNVSESVVPELTKAIVQVASSRIEKLVQRVVPDLAESAIKREIKRLQKGN
jgi:CheY-like chemotaxis protein